MNYNTDYIQGLTEASISFYNEMNGTINPDKDLNVIYEKLNNGCRITFIWITKLSRIPQEDHGMDSNYIIVGKNDKLESYLSDVNTVLQDIDSILIN